MSTATMSADIDLPVGQGAIELETAAADEGDVGATNLEGRVERHQRARLVDALLGDPHVARHHQPSRALAAAHEAAVDEQLVDARALRRHQGWQARPTAKRAISRSGSAGRLKRPQLFQGVGKQLAGTLLGGGQAEHCRKGGLVTRLVAAGGLSGHVQSILRHRECRRRSGRPARGTRRSASVVATDRRAPRRAARPARTAARISAPVLRI